VVPTQPVVRVRRQVLKKVKNEIFSYCAKKNSYLTCKLLVLFRICEFFYILHVNHQRNNSRKIEILRVKIKFWEECSVEVRERNKNLRSSPQAWKGREPLRYNIVDRIQNNVLFGNVHAMSCLEMSMQCLAWKCPCNVLFGNVMLGPDQNEGTCPDSVLSFAQDIWSSV